MVVKAMMMVLGTNLNGDDSNESPSSVFVIPVELENL